MQNYIIVTDSGTDFTEELKKELEIVQLELTIIVEGEEPKPNNEVDNKTLYEMLRAKKKATTSAVNVGDFKDVMRPYLEAGTDILYLGFSSGLSNTYNAGRLACEELSEEFPERKLYAVDTLCASLGQGLLVYHAAKMHLNGKSIEEVRDFAENNKLRLCHWFTVDDLFFLKRGGRVSAATAVVGTMLGIKPIMHVDNEGRLTSVSKARGRRASIIALADKYGESASPMGGRAYISHSDCESDALLLAEILKEKGCAKVAVADLAREDMAEAVEDAFRYGTLVLATTTYNGGIFPFMQEFIHHLTERFFQNRTIGLIENGSWAPMAAKVIKGMLENSKNIVNAYEVAKKMGIKIISFTGATGGIMKDYSDILLNVPSTDTPRIQECHIMIGHIICELVESSIFEKSNL